MGCPIAWQPNALEPVFYGVRDEEARVPPRAVQARVSSRRGRFLSRALAVRPLNRLLRRAGLVETFLIPDHRCRVFYPSLDGSPASAPILEEECGRYPLVVFVHGMCSEAEHYKKWEYPPAQLARGGHVVVVPELPEIAGGTEPQQADGDLTVISWVRTASDYRAIVAPAPATASSVIHSAAVSRPASSRRTRASSAPSRR